MLASRGGKLPEAPKAPARAAVGGSAPVAGEQEITLAGGEVVKLTAREVEMCATKKLDLAKYAATRASIRARSNGS